MVEWLDISAFDFHAALVSLGVLMLFALCGWLVSLAKKNVSIVDSMWSVMFVLSLAAYMYMSGSVGWRAVLVLGMASIWAVRLSAYITWRNHGQAEDHRYQQIRANNQPYFALKSIYIVFGLQAILAWFISFPMLAAASDSSPLGWFDAAGLTLWLFGMYFEVVGDAQLASFRKNPKNRGKVLDSGLWRYTRHPNYFGEFALQWGFFLIAVGAGGAWTIFAPLLISFLLLKVSGVALLEKDIENRRPEYRDYIRSTNAFFPGRPRMLKSEPVLFIGIALGLSLPLVSVPTQASTPVQEWNFAVEMIDRPIDPETQAEEARIMRYDPQ